MNKYIFITDEGITYQPNSNEIEPDCYNSQVIGIIEGENEDEAYSNLIKKYEYLNEMEFNEVYCYQIKSDVIKKKFYLK